MWDSKLRGANIHDPLIGLGPLIAQTADSRGLFETKETLISLPSTSGVLSLNCSSRVGGPVEWYSLGTTCSRTHSGECIKEVQ